MFKYIYIFVYTYNIYNPHVWARPRPTYGPRLGPKIFGPCRNIWAMGPFVCGPWAHISSSPSPEANLT